MTIDFLASSSVVLPKVDRFGQEKGTKMFFIPVTALGLDHIARQTQLSFLLKPGDRAHVLPVFCAYYLKLVYKLSTVRLQPTTLLHPSFP